MASPGELVTAVAEALGLPEQSVTVHDRNLVVAGLRTRGGRGWSAARVSARDAAHVITAALGSSLVKDSAASVKRYAATIPDRRRSSAERFAGLGLDELTNLANAHSFIDALEGLIASAASGAIAKMLVSDATGSLCMEVSVLTPGTLGNIRISGMPGGQTAHVTYVLPDPSDQSSPHKSASARADWEAQMRQRAAAGDMEQYRRISERTILRVAGLLASDPKT